MIRKTLTLLVLCSFCLYTTAQKKEKNFKFGLETNAYYSTASANGLNFLAAIQFGKHHFSVGPRLTYNRMLGRNSYPYDVDITHKDVKGVIDFNYRYHAYNLSEKWNLFGKLNIAYYYHHHDYQRYHDPSVPSPAQGIVFPNDPEAFNLRSDETSNSLIIFLGPGIRHSFSKRFYLTSSAGIGFPISLKNQTFSNVDIDEDYLKMTSFNFTWWAYWNFDFGVGFQFGD